MSIWRTKRRYEENRRFSERANSALLATGMLINREEGLSLTMDSEEIATNLQNGQELLQDLRKALLEPETADDYTFALAQNLCDHWRTVPKNAAGRLSEAISALQKAEEDTSHVEGLEQAQRVLEDIEKIAGTTSESEARQLRNNLVN
jgi:hypothetical protein